MNELIYPTIDDIREVFARKFRRKEFVYDKTGVKTIDISPAFFIANEETIFGEVNHDYVKREIEWYESMSLYVADIPGKTPKIWNDIADNEGRIHSNYGYLIFSQHNSSQYENCRNQLAADSDTRRAIMIYTRPEIQHEHNRGGMSDFICTNTVQYRIKNGILHAYVNMRSNDAYFGYRNDRAWQQYVLDKLARDLKVQSGNLYWFTGSLHIYESQFKLIKDYASR